MAYAVPVSPYLRSEDGLELGPDTLRTWVTGHSGLSSYWKIDYCNKKTRSDNLLLQMRMQK